jgi:hypothetical protein
LLIALCSTTFTCRIFYFAQMISWNSHFFAT